MQIIQRHVAAPARANALHRGLVFAAPGVGKGYGVNPRQDGGNLAGDGCAPVHAGAENVEYECLRHYLLWS